MPIHGGSLQFGPANCRGLVIFVEHGRTFDRRREYALDRLSTRIQQLHEQASGPQSLPIITRHPRRNRQLVRSLLPKLVDLAFQPVHHREEVLLMPDPHLLVVIVAVHQHADRRIREHRFPVMLIFGQQPCEAPRRFRIFHGGGFSHLIVGHAFDLPAIIEFARSRFRVHPDHIRFSIKKIVVMLAVRT